MPLGRCGECGHELSSKSAPCPKCGTTISSFSRPAYSGWLPVALILGAIAVVGAIATKGILEWSGSSERAYAIGDWARVGNTTYALRGAWWSDRLSNSPLIDKRPNAKFLFVVIAVRNDDNKARAIPPFKLIDENGMTYDSESSGLTIDRALGLITDLGPSVSKQGLVVFDVPPGRTYWLEVDAGSWHSESALIKVVPAEKR